MEERTRMTLRGGTLMSVQEWGFNEGSKYRHAQANGK
jgi:hypothetical protein